MHREEKERLQRLAFKMTGVRVSGLAGLYVYFLLLATSWMEDDGYAAWLIPSEFMDVNYGTALKDFLTDRVTLIRSHRFDPDEVQFGDALVSSVVLGSVWRIEKLSVFGDNDLKKSRLFRFARQTLVFKKAHRRPATCPNSRSAAPWTSRVPTTSYLLNACDLRTNGQSTPTMPRTTGTLLATASVRRCPTSSASNAACHRQQ